MRQQLIAVLALLVLLVLAPPASAEVQTSQSSTVCVVNEPQITEGSGLVAVDDGYRIVNDGGSQVVVYRLNDECELSGTTTASLDPYDVEDLALDDDGRLWLADIGDNLAARDTVAVEIVPDQAGAVTATIRRFSYPDGPRDAEALLVDGEGRIVIVTKTISGLSGVYRSEPVDLDGNAGTLPLQRIGQIQLTATGTAGGPVGAPINNLMVTGAARCGAAVALRSYTDAYVWLDADDPADAIVNAEPVVIALPAQPQGESITFTPDCAALLVHSEGVGQPLVRVELPAQPVASDPLIAEQPPSPEEERSTVVVVLVAIFASLLAIVIVIRVVGWRRRRSRRR